MTQEDLEYSVLLNICRSNVGDDQKLTHSMRAVETVDDILLLRLIEVVVEYVRRQVKVEACIVAELKLLIARFVALGERTQPEGIHLL